ncbi:hypothetical protein BIY24_10030 [Halobacteriovorax marinus]|uniref:hypothetical protein n=1 Tax=Halobacteriovorax marinus TaxID=97084 RepID=UPI000BC33A02|nr:hypothetical protein [Halobacteriovorax marinus]ATH08272.1 hypothetical protein BIY24_10030 [Halobacteriovorax marinus]
MSNIKAEEFLKIADQFKLGHLPTEMQNPRTIGLSGWANNDLQNALNVIKEIDLDLLHTALEKYEDMARLTESIQETIRSKGRIFLCGCGATGRLSLALEAIWNKSGKDCGRVISFMAGGDVALIHSIENFEDHPEYGERQLLELGFGENDLLIAITEGGETPFVIGAAETAARVSKRSPYFLYCNPDDILCKTVERSKRVIENKSIEKLNLTTGEMVLAGSTRMQASTIQMLVTGMALFNYNKDWLLKLIKKFEAISANILTPFIERESEIYKEGAGLIYKSDAKLGISVLTDTTERSPTFSLLPFEENSGANISHQSLCYLSLMEVNNIEDAWKSLLDRPPRSLEWNETKILSGIDRLYRFDISSELVKKRGSYCRGKQYIFSLQLRDEKLNLSLDGRECEIDFSGFDLLSVHIITKILLNTHSTLVMGRLGRYESNIMTWVRPSNNKLIDRTIRYVDILLRERNIERSYEQICEKLFEVMEGASKDDPLVLKTLEGLI